MGVYMTGLNSDTCVYGERRYGPPLCERRKERGVGRRGVCLSVSGIYRETPPQHLFSPSYRVFCGRAAPNEASLYISVQASEPMLMRPRRHAPSTLFTHGAHTRTKASCVCRSTEGAHISLYQRAGDGGVGDGGGDRVISGGNC